MFQSSIFSAFIFLLSTCFTFDINAASQVDLILPLDSDEMKEGTSNYLAYVGIEHICVSVACYPKIQFAANGSALSSEAWVKSVETAAKDSQLVITMGYYSAAAVVNASRQFPQTSFGVLDYDLNSEDISPPMPNVRSVVFPEDQMGYIAGIYAAALVENNGTVGVLGGQEIAPVKRYVNGYLLGVKSVCPQCKVVCGYANGFSNDGNEGILAAEKYLKAGVQAVSHDAGGTGTAFLARVTDNGKWVIGFGTDEWITNYSSGSTSGSTYVAGSVLKRYDVAVNTLIRDSIGQFTSDTLFMNISAGGIDMASCHESCSQIPKNATEIVNTAILRAMQNPINLGIDWQSGNIRNGTKCDIMALEDTAGKDSPKISAFHDNDEFLFKTILTILFLCISFW